MSGHRESPRTSWWNVAMGLGTLIEEGWSDDEILDFAEKAGGFHLRARRGLVALIAARRGGMGPAEAIDARRTPS